MKLSGGSHTLRFPKFSFHPIRRYKRTTFQDLISSSVSGSHCGPLNQCVQTTAIFFRIQEVRLDNIFIQ